MRKQIMILNKKDNVATALEDLTQGIIITIGNFNLKINIQENIPFCHKIAIKNIEKDEQIIKYGEVIGTAISNIKIGEHAHVHNIKSNRG